MKRRVICIFSLVFWLIALSTFLSIRIEEWMTPVISTLDAKRSGERLFEFPADGVVYDETGMMHLYCSFEGSGWEKGQRVHDIGNNILYIEGDNVIIDFGGDCIRYSTRALREGEAVTKPKKFERANDTWVAVFPDGVPECEPAMNVTIAETTDNLLVVNAENANIPFMEGYARTLINPEKDEDYYFQEPNSSVYSLNELKQFMDCMVLLGILMAAILFVVVDWAWSFIVSRDYKKNAKLLMINGGAALVLLALSPLLLHFVNLPQSMLPQFHITDFAHYSAEFSKIFSVLDTLAANGSSIAAESLAYAEGRMVLFFILCAMGIVLGIVLIIAELLTSKRKNSKKGRHAAW